MKNVPWYVWYSACWVMLLACVGVTYWLDLDNTRAFVHAVAPVVVIVVGSCGLMVWVVWLFSRLAPGGGSSSCSFTSKEMHDLRKRGVAVYRGSPGGYWVNGIPVPDEDGRSPYWE